MTGIISGCSSDSKISGNFYEDVEAGLLFTNSDGKITNVKGKVIKEYEDINVLDNGSLSQDGSIMEGILTGPGGQLSYFIPEPVDYGNDSGADKIGIGETPVAYEEQCCTEMEEVGSDTYKMGDDGSYFDEVVLGTWFDENGNPLADIFPDRLDDALRGADRFTTMDYFKYIDGINYTMDDLKRSRSTINDNFPEVTALLIRDIAKDYDDNNNVIFRGEEQFSGEVVVIHGDFSRILNGDDLLLFGICSGLAADDTPNFRGIFAEISNSRFEK